MPLEKPELKLKLELAIPSPAGAPPQKFSVSRALKAKWSEDPGEITYSILNEIKNYKGSYIGDTVLSLRSLVQANGGVIKEEKSRSNDLSKYAAAMIDSLVFSGIQDKLHKELLKSFDIINWDGTSSDIGPISADELKNVDIEKVMMLLAPKIKHALFLMSKDLEKKDI